jgi:hypothetical protein
LIASVLGLLGTLLGGLLGGGGGDRPTLDEWDRAASKVCRSSADVTAKIGQPDTHDRMENVRRARLWAREFRRAGNAIERIGTPSEDAAGVEEFTALFDALGDNYDAYATDQEAAPISVEVRDRDIREKRRLFGRWNQLGERLGARGCA